MSPNPLLSTIPKVGSLVEFWSLSVERPSKGLDVKEDGTLLVESRWSCDDSDLPPFRPPVDPDALAVFDKEAVAADDEEEVVNDAQDEEEEEEEEEGKEVEVKGNETSRS